MCDESMALKYINNAGLKISFKNRYIFGKNFPKQVNILNKTLLWIYSIQWNQNTKNEIKLLFNMKTKAHDCRI